MGGSCPAVAADPVQGGGHKFVVALGKMAGAAVVVADPGDPPCQRALGSRPAPPPPRSPSTPRPRDRQRQMRRQRPPMAFPLAPGSEPGPVGGVVATGRLGAEAGRCPGHPSNGLNRQGRACRRSGVAGGGHEVGTSSVAHQPVRHRTRARRPSRTGSYRKSALRRSSVATVY